MTARHSSLAALLRPGQRVAVGDGIGMPRAHLGELADAARSVGDIALVVGWFPTAADDLDPTAYADVRTLMPGWGLRQHVEAGGIHAPPVRFSAIPALLAGPLRPDVLLATVVPRAEGGFGLGTEVSWIRSAVDSGATIAGVVNTARPRCEVGDPLPADRLVIVGESTHPATELAFTEPTAIHRAIADHVSALVPVGARIQVGLGALGTAVLDAVRTPVRVESGLLPEAVVDLDRRGLLVGEPISTYLAGGAELLAWADGRPILHPLAHTHDPTRLSTGVPLIAVNTAIEVDEQGQVNVEGAIGAGVGGIGGHPDYAVAGARSIGGLSVVALASRHRGTPTLVERLSAPVTTASHDVDVLVTEHGSADLRGLDRAERARAIRRLFDLG